MIITGNEPAMPFAWKQIVGKDGTKCDIVSSEQKGLTIRQQFAMAAMQSLGAEFQTSNSHELAISERIATRAVRMADALISELNK